MNANKFSNTIILGGRFDEDNAQIHTGNDKPLKINGATIGTGGGGSLFTKLEVSDTDPATNPKVEIEDGEVVATTSNPFDAGATNIEVGLGTHGADGFGLFNDVFPNLADQDFFTSIIRNNIFFYKRVTINNINSGTSHELLNDSENLTAYLGGTDNAGVQIGNVKGASFNLNGTINANTGDPFPSYRIGSYSITMLFHSNNSAVAASSRTPVITGSPNLGWLNLRGYIPSFISSQATATGSGKFHIIPNASFQCDDASTGFLVQSSGADTNEYKVPTIQYISPVENTTPGRLEILFPALITGGDANTYVSLYIKPTVHFFT